MSRASLCLLASIALLPALDVRAEDPPAETLETYGNLTVGGGSVSGLDESSKYQEYREIPNGFFLSNFDFGLKKSDWTFDLNAIDLLQEDQRIVATAKNAGGLRLIVGYDQTPVWFSNTSATLFANAGGGRMLFPEPLRQQLESTSPPGSVGPLLGSGLAAAQPFVDLRYRRDTTFADLRWPTPLEGLTLRAGFNHERRSGTHPQTVSTNFSVGPDVTEFAGATDFTTQSFRLGIDYARSIFWVGGEFLWSNFHDNMSSSLAGGTGYEDAYIIDNPLRATDGTPGVPDPGSPNNRAGAQLLLSAPPDSNSSWTTLNGGVKLGQWGRVSLRYGMGHSTQDEVFLPFTLNTAITPPPLLVVLKDGSPVGQFEGSVDLTRWDAQLDGHPLRWLSFEVYGRGYEYDNQTPLYSIPNWVDSDVEVAATSAEADPLSYKTTRFGGGATFRPLARLSIDVGLARESWTRHHRPVPNTDEDIFKVLATWAPASWGSFRLGYRNGDRTLDSYADGPSDPAGVRMYDLANRKQDRYDFLADFTPIDRLSFGVQFHELDNDYPDTTFGRTEDKSRGWGVDFSVDAGRGVTVSGNYGEDRYSYVMQSEFRLLPTGPGDPANDWGVSPHDKIISYGLGVNATLIPKRLTLDVHGTITDSTGSQESFFAPGGLGIGDPEPFPDVSDKLRTFDANLRWLVKERMSVIFAASYESWDLTDFQRDVMQPWMGAFDGGSDESVFLGMRVPDYSVNWLRVLLSYSF
jgi:MtrB/PioB family decaheme-associated outer membrane protein